MAIALSPGMAADKCINPFPPSTGVLKLRLLFLRKCFKMKMFGTSEELVSLFCYQNGLQIDRNTPN